MGREKPKPKGRTCARDKCKAWYRPSKYRSAGFLLEFCSPRCMKKAQAEALIKRQTERDW